MHYIFENITKLVSSVINIFLIRMLLVHMVNPKITLMKKNLHPKKEVKTNVAWPIILMVVITSALFLPRNSFAQGMQSGSTDTTKAPAKPVYPKVVGYVSFILPLETYSAGSFTPDFSSTTKIGFPIGVNVLYSDKFGFSYEFTPTVKENSTTNGVSSILFDPGTMFRFEHGFTIITRLAFATDGQYGFTPVFNQVYARTKAVNYFVAGSIPVRFGGGGAATIGVSLQIGFIFN